MANEDIILSIGVDVSSIKNDILRAGKEAESILKNQKLVANLSYQFGVPQGTIRSSLKRVMSDAEAEWDRLRQSSDLGQFIVDTSATNQAAMQQAMDQQLNNLPRLRYALYDISSTAQIAATSLAAFATGAVTASAQYETAFTAVERTSGVTGDSVAALKDNLKLLAQQIPLTFQDISGIATLGAQLGISATNLTDFTRVVAEFSAVSNVSVENAAQAFGSLSTLLNLSADEYQNLGSAIAFAGTKSVATESEIISVATQIGGVAAAARFSAKDVVGLSVALSSLRIPAEQSRGALTKFIQEANRSAAEGGDRLNIFASILGTSAEEARNLAQTDMSQFFNRFISGLSGLDSTQMTQALDALNLSELRVTNTLTRLATNMDIVTESQSNVNTSFDEGTFISDAYALKVDDIASKIQILTNTFQNLAATIGDSVNPALGFILDVLINVGKGFNIIAQSEIGQFFLTVGVGASIFSAIVFGLVSTLALFTAGSFAVTTALSGLVADGLLPANWWMTQFMGKLFGVNVAAAQTTSGLGALTIAEWKAAQGAQGAAAGMNVFKLTLISTGIGAVVVLLGSLAAAFIGAQQAMTGTAVAGGELTDAQGRTQAQIDALNAQIDEQNAKLTNLGSAGGPAAKAAQKIRTLGDYAKDLSTIWSRAFEIRFSGQAALDDITKSFSSIAKATSDARDEINSLNADISQLTADQALQEYFLSVANAYGDTLSAAKINANLAKIKADLISKNKSLSSAQDATNKTLVGNSDAAVQNRQDIRGLVSQYQTYLEALAKSGASQEELRSKAAKLKADFVAQATQLGYNSDELGIYELAFNDVTVAIDNVPRDITVDVNADPALQALNEFVAAARQAGVDAGSGAAANFEQNFQPRIPDIEIPTSVKEPTEENWRNLKSSVNAAMKRYGFFTATELMQASAGIKFNNGYGIFQTRASGGPIYGPGTSTSDSIPAMLSNGEYVIQASAVRQYGVGFFDQLNQMKTPQFFNNGGPVVQQSGGMVSLSPEDRALLRNFGGSGNIVLYADSRELARSVNDGNRQIVAQGGRP